jgi:hypothetical protein
MIGTIIGWIIFSIIIGVIGANRKIGFLGAFFLSLLLSPIIGLIVTLVSKSNEAEKFENEILVTQKKQQEILENISQQNVSGITDDLKKVKELLDNGVINQEEFEKMKSKLLDSFNNSPAPTDLKLNLLTTNNSDNLDSYTAPEIKSQSKSIESSFLSGSYEDIQIEFIDGIKGNIYHKTSSSEYYFKNKWNSQYYDDYEHCINALHCILTKGELLKAGFVCTYS